ncbi:hypothetical protein COBT_000281 [Conglomerata obtusa]
MNNLYNHPVMFGNCFLNNIFSKIAPGTLILLKEDEYSYHHQTFIKSFIAQNIDSRIRVFSKDISTLNIPDHAKQKNVSNEDIEQMLIAWRYSSIDIEKCEAKFDFSTKMNLNGYNYKLKTLFESKNFFKILKEQKDRTIVCVISFLSPVWNVQAGFDDFFFNIKKLCRQKNMIFIASIPTFLNIYDNHKLYFDIILRFNSYAFTNFFPNYNGIIEIEKKLEIEKLKENSHETNKFGFVSTRNGLQIEKICLPPDDVDIDANLGCNTSITF